jgi:DNA-binding CsgD family transcriptional regulator
MRHIFVFWIETVRVMMSLQPETSSHANRTIDQITVFEAAMQSKSFVVPVKPVQPRQPDLRSPACGVGCRCAACVIRELLQLIDFAEAEAMEAREILLDIGVDGSRYLFVRVPEPAESEPALSPREQEIVRMVSQGSPNKVIADVLNISPWTVCTHLRRIFAKLGVTSRAAMVAKVMLTRD